MFISFERNNISTDDLSGLAAYGYFSVLPFTFLVNRKTEGKKVFCLETVKIGLGDKVLVVKAKNINPEQVFFQL